MSAVTKKSRGQPTKLTPERLTTIVRMLEAGGYIEEACEAVGIVRSTYYGWLARGQDEADRVSAGIEPNPKETQFLEFLNTVSKANAEGIMGHVLNIDRAAKDGTWQASAWILERKQPHKWGRRDRTEHTGEGGGPIRVAVSTEELERKVARVLERRALEA